MLKLAGRIAAAALAATLFAAPLSAQDEPDVDPVGTWSFSVAIEGQNIIGTMTISGSKAEGYTGKIETDMGPATMSDIAVDGKYLMFYVPEGDADVEVVVEGDRFSGMMSSGMGEAEFVGERKSR